MDSKESRKLLALYRFGIDDEEPQFQEALERAHEDEELGEWLHREGEIHSAISRRFREIPVPEKLLREIVMQGQDAGKPDHGWGRYLQLAAAIVILCGLGWYWFRPSPRNTFQAYESYLSGLVSHPYRMSLETDNLDKIRSFLRNNQAPADYVLHPQLTRANTLGCATLSWNGNPVSMLCFAGGDGRKIFLFVVNRRAIPDSPEGTRRPIRQLDGFSVTGWSEGERAYVLAAEGDAETLDGYL